MWHVKFLTLTDKFGYAPMCVQTIENFETKNQCILAIQQYAKENGFKDVKMVDDGEYGCIAVIATTTPGGRKGRNIAFVGPLEG